MVRIFPMACVLTLAAVSPAGAALETPDVYAEDVADIALTGTEDTVHAVCVPPAPQYIPAFIRGSDGTIVGISYTIIEYVC
jgi:hypothetical protein